MCRPCPARSPFLRADTKLTKLDRVSFFGPLPDVWAAAAMRQLGREACITPLWVHALAVSGTTVPQQDKPAEGCRPLLQLPTNTPLPRTAPAAGGAAGDARDRQASDEKGAVRVS